MLAGEGKGVSDLRAGVASGNKGQVTVLLWPGAALRVVMGSPVSQVWGQSCLSGISGSRAGISLRGAPQGDDQGRDEHCETQLLPRLP